MPEFDLTDPAALLSLAILVVALAVAVALVVYLARFARRAPAADGEADEAPPPRTLAPGESATLAELLEGGRDPEPFLMRFVDDAATGERAGESIAVSGERLVVKGEEGFVAVPLEDVVVRDDALTIGEGVNWEDAKRAGEEWQTAAENPVTYDEDGNPVR